MSTNSECEFIQVKGDEWFYVLEHYRCDDEDDDGWYDHGDWRLNATAYGPFASQEKADEHLDEKHPNPGGSSTQALPDGVDELDLSKDPMLERLIVAARESMAAEKAEEVRLSRARFRLGW
jgi:hypothetical protein